MHWRFFRRCWPALSVALLAGFAPAQSRAEYRLQPGDVLMLSVAGSTAPAERSEIDIDGNAVFPLAGSIPAAGHTIADVERGVRRALASKPVDQTTSAGIQSYFVDPAEVTVSVAQYSPIYVRGDVAKPGAVDFHPGMTVRQAIAVAGGYDLLRFRVDNPFVQSAQLRGEYDQYTAELANTLAQIARLNAELAGSTTPDFAAAQKVPVPRTMLAEIIQAEQQQLDLRLADLANQKQHLQQEIANGASRYTLLTTAQSKEQQARDADAADLAHTTGLLDKGLSTATRVAESRRDLLNSSILLLNTSAQIGSADVTLENEKRALDSIDPQHRLAVLKQLEDARAQLATIQARLSATSEQLLYMGSEKTGLAGGVDAAAKITVFASGSAAGGGHAVAGSDALMPGDLIDVTLVPADRTAQQASSGQ